MSNRELAKKLIDHVPESKLLYVVAYLQGVVVPNETPNADLASMAEIEEMIKTGGGEHFTGSTADLFTSILAGDD